MDSVRITSDLPRVSEKIALMGSLVSRLVAFCLLYFAPALAYEQGAPAPAPETVEAAAQVPAATESLDPKHGKDHDEDHEAKRGRGHRQQN
jgi:hypothetical protein